MKNHLGLFDSRHCCTFSYWKRQLSIPFSPLMNQSAVSSLKLLTKILRLMRAAAGMQWKNLPLPPCRPSSPSLRFPSTPPSSHDYITLVCEHSTQHSFSVLTLATPTPRLPPTVVFPLAEGPSEPCWYWLSHPSLRCGSLSAHVDILSY